ncbi:uncharacterized protein F4807DRAFT_101971 [Annulohypoxylon truncatum]|uniref:uncharacterized protein n=1 Tax=Annulohypoxylon truncatum TaxID=327061 RepID=UPI00200869A1|nr:uncharacterized protein F4807DRAFT_101971 [Annulohypoxylon truncatum]KAI1209258.1 hypothetical protein F4807DRAFT_101971 [Annulohypoxylon truncatum]
MASTKHGNSDDRVLYFAYGSNLSLTQMQHRCPNSQPIGLAHLPGWTWLINERGYANIVQGQALTSVSSSTFSPSSASLASSLTSHIPRLSGNDEKDKKGVEKGVKEILESAAGNESKRGVYGILYRLHPDEEKMLDLCEGVPWAYEKWFLDATLLPHADSQDTEEGETVRALVYIDSKRVLSSAPRKEYVARMNRGIDEATKHFGLPKTYVDAVMRPFIPERATG